MTDEARLERHGRKLEEHDRELLTIKQVVLGPHGSNGLRQEVRENEEEIRRLREQEVAPLRSARDEAQAVRDTRKSMMRIGAGVIVAQVAIITLLLRVAEVL